MRFVVGDVHSLTELSPERFDAIMLSDLVNDLWDVQAVLEAIRGLATARTRVIINTYSRPWEPLLGLAEKLKLAQPTLHQNWLTTEGLTNLFDLTDFEVIRHWQEILRPLGTPVIHALCNRLLVRVRPFRLLALTNFLVARESFRQGVDLWALRLDHRPSAQQSRQRPSYLRARTGDGPQHRDGLRRGTLA